MGASDVCEEIGVGNGQLQPSALTAGELIDDQALVSASDDAFRLTDFVTELVAVCEQTSLPANIALFGAWGSGKSSLANLLEQRFSDGNHDAVAFARFDAFKYAGLALRRHLLSQLAEQFEIGDKKYDNKLYRATKTNKYELPSENRRTFGMLLVAMAILVAIVLLAVSALVGAAAAIGSGTFAPAFRATLEHGAPSLLFASGLVATLLAIAGKTFTVESTQAPPSTEEEFGKLFDELVKEVLRRKKCARIVILIDELDRCSPGQVVAVLETIKTFLHVDPCVFVVAADKQAIEQALSEEAREATPADVVNPYYSAGSAYLDKIFQQQLSLPPLLPRTLSQFALDLVAERPGVWRQISNKAELVTVLVPEHVRSPRRVKVLLNSFVLAYRLALQRAADDALDPEVGRRASEIAKLVCLQTEFPLFAAELRVDARMAQATLALAEDPSLTVTDLGLPGFTQDAYARAAAFATGHLPVDTVIARSRRAARQREEQPLEAGEAAAATENQEEELEAVVPIDDRSSFQADVADIVASQARQLTAYLRRTRRIPGPNRDLVFLESSGAAFALPAELADALERNARNGASVAVLQSIASLQPNVRPATIRLLCSLARDSIGVEMENVCHCLLETVRDMEENLDDAVDDVLAALQVVSGQYALQADDLAGALKVALLRDSPSALELREQILKRPEARADETLGLMILSRASDLRPREQELIGPVLTRCLLASTPEQVFEAVDGLPDKTLNEMIEEQHESLLSELAALDDQEAVETFAKLVEHAAHTRKSAASSLMRILLSLDSQPARDAAESILDLLAPIAEPELVRQVLAAAAVRAVSGWKTWLGSLNAATVRELPDTTDAIVALAAQLLARRFAAEHRASEQDTSQAISLLSSLINTAQEPPSGSVEEAFAELTQTPAVDNEQADMHLALHEVTRELVEASLLPSDVASKLIIGDVVGTLSGTIEPTADTNMLSRYILTASNLSLPFASSSDAEHLILAAKDCSWLQEDIASAVILHGSSHQKLGGEDVPEPLTTVEIDAVAALGETSEPPLAAWVRAFSPAPQALQKVLLCATNARKPGTALVGAVSELAGAWTRQENQQFYALLAGSFVHDRGGLPLIQIARTDALPRTFIATELAKLFDAASNNVERERIMQLWQTSVLTDETAQRTLIDRVYEPLLHQGKGAAKIALDYFALVRNPPSKAARDRTRAAIKSAVKGDKALERRAKELLQDAGWEARGRLARLTGR